MIYLAGTFYGRQRSITGVRLRQRYAGIVAVARLRAAGKTRDEIAIAMNAPRKHIEFLISRLHRFTAEARP